MKYWLHRNTGGEFAAQYAQSLLSKGFLSIGWKGLSNDENMNLIQKQGWTGVNKVLTKNGWELERNRYCLSRFISEMKKGDLVVVPFPGRFSIYEIADDIIYSNESLDAYHFTDAIGIKAEKKAMNGYITFVNNRGEEIDLGFYKKGKLTVLVDYILVTLLLGKMYTTPPFHVDCLRKKPSGARLFIALRSSRPERQ